MKRIPLIFKSSRLMFILLLPGIYLVENNCGRGGRGRGVIRDN
jgi:hypothetical protein